MKVKEQGINPGQGTIRGLKSRGLKLNQGDVKGLKSRGLSLGTLGRMRNTKVTSGGRGGLSSTGGGVSSRSPLVFDGNLIYRTPPPMGQFEAARHGETLSINGGSVFWTAGTTSPTVMDPIDVATGIVAITGSQNVWLQLNLTIAQLSESLAALGASGADPSLKMYKITSCGSGGFSTTDPSPIGGGDDEDDIWEGSITLHVRICSATNQGRIVRINQQFQQGSIQVTDHVDGRILVVV